jgi:hypothetical protein
MMVFPGAGAFRPPFVLALNFRRKRLQLRSQLCQRHYRIFTMTVAKGQSFRQVRKVFWSAVEASETMK